MKEVKEVVFGIIGGCVITFGGGWYFGSRFVCGTGVVLPGWLLIVLVLGGVILGMHWGVKTANPSRYTNGP